MAQSGVGFYYTGYSMAIWMTSVKNKKAASVVSATGHCNHCPESWEMHHVSTAVDVWEILEDKWLKNRGAAHSTQAAIKQE